MNMLPFHRPRQLGKIHVRTVTLAHGGGGKAMKDLIDDVFVAAFDNAALAPLQDQARLNLASLALHGDRLAFTTDSFVVHPLLFPGGDIGKLAICGTINDLAVGGAMPLYMACAVIVAAGNLRGRVVGIYILLIAANLVVWAWALITFRHFPLLLGTAFLAYSFGLRHAVDADHIAANDNVTRKLMQEGKRSVAVGLFFSLGHSTIVVIASVAVAATATAFKDQLESFHTIGGIVGTLVSASFLLAIAIINIIILAGFYKTFRHVKAGGRYVDEDLNMLLAQRGFLAGIFRPLFRIIGQSWHMYPLGFLFGLSFDTATEVGLLGISAAEASKGLSVWSILVFPALFTVGMMLIDTTDSIRAPRKIGASLHRANQIQGSHTLSAGGWHGTAWLLRFEPTL